MKPELLERLREQIQRHYVLPDRIPMILERLKSRVESGAYSSLEGVALAEAITADLREVSNDVHFKMLFRSEPYPLSENSESESPEEVAEFRRIAAYHNHGCERVERLAGNVGYWKISEFYDLIDGSGPTFVASMRLLERTDSLIVDVRGNSGGDPATVALACSFFFDVEPVHLNTLESQQGKVKQQWWTLPQLDCNRYLGKPVYVLTDESTFSAAEEFAYDLQSLGRAKVVGSRTAGASHPRETYRLDEHYSINVPMARPVNPYTLSNWDLVGVQPDVDVDPARGFESAYYLALMARREVNMERDEADANKAALDRLLAQNSWLTDVEVLRADGE